MPHFIVIIYRKLHLYSTLIMMHYTCHIKSTNYCKCTIMRFKALFSKLASYYVYVAIAVHPGSVTRIGRH